MTQNIFEQAQANVSAILAEAFGALKAKPPSQDELRAIFEDAKQTDEGLMAFEQEYGIEERERQEGLAVQREGQMNG